ncbi:integral membrane protein [Colletotrichum tofieldiae]|nr:integral membrane protein [Colletotrichum tofieldiae]
MSYISSAVNVITDISVATIPIFLLRHIQMRPQLKLYIQLIFGLGLMAGVASIVRLGFTDAYMDTTDFLRKVVLCTVLECGLGIIAGSLPILRTFFARLAKDYSTDAEKGHHSGGDDTKLVTFSHYNLQKQSGCESNTYVTITEGGNENDSDSNESADNNAKSSAAANQQAITVTTDLHQTSNRVDELKPEETRTTTEVRVRATST